MPAQQRQRLTQRAHARSLIIGERVEDVCQPLTVLQAGRGGWAMAVGGAVQAEVWAMGVGQVSAGAGHFAIRTSSDIGATLDADVPSLCCNDHLRMPSQFPYCAIMTELAHAASFLPRVASASRTKPRRKQRAKRQGDKRKERGRQRLYMI